MSCGPGGRLGFTAWTPDSLTVRILAIGREYAPPRPADAPDPFRWGDPVAVAALFDPLGCDVQTRRRAVTLRYESWEQWRDDGDAHGGAVLLQQQMPAEVYDAMRQRQQELTAAHNDADDGTVRFDSDYLEIIVRKPA